MASLAEFYSANLSEEVKKGMRQKVTQGGWPHKPPRGYVLSPTPQGTRRIVVPDPVLAPVIRWMFEMVPHHPALVALAQSAAARGLMDRTGRPLSVWVIQKMLRNPSYIGRVRWGPRSTRGDTSRW